MEELLKKLNEQLATTKVMIYSLYKSITLDEDLENITQWENECKKIAKELLEKQENKKQKNKE